MLPKTILVTNKTNIRFLCGFSGTSGYLILHGKRGFLFTDARYHLVAQKVLPLHYSLIDITDDFDGVWKKFLHRMRIKKIGIEGGSISIRFARHLQKISKKVRFVDIGLTMDERRVVKKKFELKHIEQAQHITDRIFRDIKKLLKAGTSERALAWTIETLAHAYGADDVSFPPIVAIQEHSVSPHHQNTERKLKRGDMILIDMGVIYRGYCSDMTRVLFTKTPTPEQRTIYELVLTAQETVIKKLHAGTTGIAADHFARSMIKKAGYGKCFGHSLGHGVGLDIHELPNLSQKDKKKIPAGSVVTVEPGVYLPGKFGVRLEDMVVVRKSGVRNLTKSPKSVQECVIRLH